ncbi:pantetheine-phosphate adenylyltransferase [Trichlorobacter lovleyi]|uniref:Phosphopantetheine adenylyltransferase n=1 Tax=Trichlorobacter lovleyi (strain ATCC BAA-1151 / DSM 17278 / SZ) TaxID=398767 RepID=B3EB91_TRIL1|nr:pantetheine-phosphate adenylyltransferase [Trichlorobacter lovleyi]ACD95485.1 pantetheine-phosphate adenylyltransferase [Trichlorobacter lovleyi SZ]
MPHSRIAIYPGSFDPITYGHLDIIQRGLKIFKHVIVAVARNSQKNALFNIEERVDLIKTVLKDEPRVSVDTFTGLLIDYVASKEAHVVIRGLRAISDFEYEFQIAQMNSTIGRDIETLFMMTSVQYGYLSSSIVREVCSLRGPVDSFVPPEVKTAMQQKYGLNR